MRTAFPYFGSKRRVAADIWQRFGDPRYFYEPFAGSLATLLKRPKPTTKSARYEYVGDTDCMITNFFRAARFGDPLELARMADWPEAQLDLEARTDWLDRQRSRLHRHLLADPKWFDIECAAWFAWVSSVTINRDSRSLVLRRNSGVRRRNEDLPAYFTTLAGRLKDVSFHYGDWMKLANAAVMESRHSDVAILLDPPYAYSTGREKGLYATDSGDVAALVKRWAVARATTHPKLKIALCGYAGEHQMPSSWEEFGWNSTHGKGRERIWFSPRCQQPAEPKSEAIQSRETVQLQPVVIRSGDNGVPLGCRPVTVLARL